MALNSHLRHDCKISLTCVGICLALTVPLAAAAAWLTGISFVKVCVAAAYGSLSFLLVQTCFLLCAYGFTDRFLSSGLVLYRAVYAFVFKYLILVILLFVSFRIIHLHSLSCITAFIFTLIMHAVLSLFYKEKI